MNHWQKTRHGITVVAGTAVLALTLSACGGENGPDDQAEDNGAFETVEIEHALGTAIIEDKPERVVTLGQGSTETAIALGVTPVGIEEYPWGADDTGYLPWIHEAVEEVGDELPEQFTGGTELDIEAIVDLEPDVILAPWSGITQEQYDLLDDIAPTVAYPELPWTITWEEQIETVSTALGEKERAPELIDQIEQEFEDYSHEEWSDYTFSYIYNDGPGTLGVFFPGEQRVQMVSKLGLQVDPAVEDMKEFEVEGTDSAMIGLENADMLNDSDLIFTWYSDEDNREETEGQDLYASIPAIDNGAVVAPTDQSFVTASSIISPLTVPWVLDRYEPMIDEAVENVEGEGSADDAE
ncbi:MULTISPECIES: iron-siderophore ABC transporter substrate-binding protein [Auritidibacter]|nr:MULTISPECIES: iron-siderophore ABC transporter substrate-binding protein [Auritidibacter]PXA76782.1 iron ABC transporter substrate-binding protein [Auritidibacter sp. NML120779]AXR74439.1 iron-siderophore ABC transporter substrate-binding protein [Auritidibacter sp. NML130574]PXA79322.1 iron ABC transporter substrate-binding protein [Auritidibacter sp. NML120636]RMX22318.1 iron-siderophore ABC transporter substrate-binding protein [Auritidibacter ignavus]WGH80957.1 iron-siderophore ABC tran